MAFQFPPNPIIGQEYPASAGLTFRWNGTAWYLINTQYITLDDANALYIPLTQKAAANGVATLGADVKVPVAQLPTDPGINGFRLTLTTGQPVTTSDVIGATTVYCSPYKSNRIALYDGTDWVLRSSPEFSGALGSLADGRPYDVFAYDNSGSPTIDFTQWTDDTTRAVGLTRLNGVLVKDAAPTRRYLGTFYTTTATTTEDSLAKRFLWNYYNRVTKQMAAIEPAGSWIYTLATYRQFNANPANQLDMVIGVAEDRISATCQGVQNNSVIATQAGVGIGVDATNVSGALIQTPAYTPVSGYYQNPVAHYWGFPGAGRHFLAALEASVATGISSWYGTTGVGAGSHIRSGIFGEIQG